MNKFSLYFILFIFLSACGSSKKEIFENSDLKSIFEKNDPITEEFNPKLNIKLNKIEFTIK